MSWYGWLKEWARDFKSLDALLWPEGARGYNPPPAYPPGKPIITPAPPPKKYIGAHFTTGGNIACPNCGISIQLLGGKKQFSGESHPCD